MLVRPVDEAALEPRILSMGTCRVLRVKQVGAVFFVENDVGHIDELQQRSEDWKIVAVSKGEHAYKEAHDFLMRANGDVLRTLAEDMRRARPA